MARITVEDCLNRINNRFALIHMSAKRVRQLRKGAEPSIISKNRDVVLSLREIAAGNLVVGEDVEQDLFIENQADILPEEPGGETKEEALNNDKADEGSEIPEGN